MQPVDIPDELVPPHFRKIVLQGDSSGEEETLPVTYMRPTNVPDHLMRNIVLIRLDPADLFVLQKNGGIFWLQLFTDKLPPFSVNVVEDVEIRNDENG